MYRAALRQDVTQADQQIRHDATYRFSPVTGVLVFSFQVDAVFVGGLSVKGNAGVFFEERRAVVFRPCVFRSPSPVSLVLSWRWWRRIHVVFLGDEVG